MERGESSCCRARRPQRTWPGRSRPRGLEFWSWGFQPFCMELLENRWGGNQLTEGTLGVCLGQPYDLMPFYVSFVFYRTNYHLASHEEQSGRPGVKISYPVPALIPTPASWALGIRTPSPELLQSILTPFNFPSPRRWRGLFAANWWLVC